MRSNQEVANSVFRTLRMVTENGGQRFGMSRPCMVETLDALTRATPVHPNQPRCFHIDQIMQHVRRYRRRQVQQALHYFRLVGLVKGSNWGIYRL